MHNKYFKMKNYSNIFSPTDKNLKKCSKILKNHGIAALPTETVYGLAGNAYSNRAVTKIYSLKKRPKKNPLIVHFDSLQSILKETVQNRYLAASLSDETYHYLYTGPYGDFRFFRL